MKPFLNMALGLVVMVCCFLSFSRFGDYVYGAFFQRTATFSANTLIGPVKVDNMSREAAYSKVKEYVGQWRKNAKIKIQYKESVLNFDIAMIHIAAKKSVDEATNGGRNPIFVTLSEKNFDDFVKEDFHETAANFNRQGFTKAVEHLVNESTMDGKVVLTDYLLDQKRDSQSIIAIGQVTLPISDYASFDRIVQQLSPLKLQAHSVFSFNEWTSKHVKEQITDEQASYIATALYEAALMSNFSIVERHISAQLPKYAKMGFEANIQQKRHDLKIKNDNDLTYRIELQRNGKVLSASLVGVPFLYNYSIDMTKEEEYQPRTIVKYSAQLPQGDEKIIQAGEVGYLYRIIRISKDQFGAIRREAISEDFYAPVHTVMLRGAVGGVPSSEQSEHSIEAGYDEASRVSSQRIADGVPGKQEQ